jgi:hypothetical protein
LSKAHYVLLGNGSNHTLNFFWSHSSTSSDDLPSNIFGNSGRTIEGEENRCL